MPRKTETRSRLGEKSRVAMSYERTRKTYPQRHSPNANNREYVQKQQLHESSAGPSEDSRSNRSSRAPVNHSRFSKSARKLGKVLGQLVKHACNECSPSTEPGKSRFCQLIQQLSKTTGVAASTLHSLCCHYTGTPLHHLSISQDDESKCGSPVGEPSTIQERLRESRFSVEQSYDDLHRREHNLQPEEDWRNSPLLTTKVILEALCKPEIKGAIDELLAHRCADCQIPDHATDRTSHCQFVRNLSECSGVPIATLKAISSRLEQTGLQTEESQRQLEHYQERHEKKTRELVNCSRDASQAVFALICESRVVADELKEKVKTAREKLDAFTESSCRWSDRLLERINFLTLDTDEGYGTILNNMSDFAARVTVLREEVDSLTLIACTRSKELYGYKCNAEERSAQLSLNARAKLRHLSTRAGFIGGRIEQLHVRGISAGTVMEDQLEKIAAGIDKINGEVEEIRNFINTTKEAIVEELDNVAQFGESFKREVDKRFAKITNDLSELENEFKRTLIRVDTVRQFEVETLPKIFATIKRELSNKLVEVTAETEVASAQLKTMIRELEERMLVINTYSNKVIPQSKSAAEKLVKKVAQMRRDIESTLNEPTTDATKLVKKSHEIEESIVGVYKECKPNAEQLVKKLDAKKICVDELALLCGEQLRLFMDRLRPFRQRIETLKFEDTVSDMVRNVDKSKEIFDNLEELEGELKTFFDSMSEKIATFRSDLEKIFEDTDFIVDYIAENNNTARTALSGLLERYLAEVRKSANSDVATAEKIYKILMTDFDRKLTSIGVDIHELCLSSGPKVANLQKKSSDCLSKLEKSTNRIKNRYKVLAARCRDLLLRTNQSKGISDENKKNQGQLVVIDSDLRGLFDEFRGKSDTLIQQACLSKPEITDFCRQFNSQAEKATSKLEKAKEKVVGKWSASEDYEGIANAIQCECESVGVLYRGILKYFLDGEANLSFHIDSIGKDFAEVTESMESKLEIISQDLDNYRMACDALEENNKEKIFCEQHEESNVIRTPAFTDDKTEKSDDEQTLPETFTDVMAKEKEPLKDGFPSADVSQGDVQELFKADKEIVGVEEEEHERNKKENKEQFQEHIQEGSVEEVQFKDKMKILELDNEDVIKEEIKTDDAEEREEIREELELASSDIKGLIHQGMENGVIAQEDRTKRKEELEAQNEQETTKRRSLSPRRQQRQKLSESHKTAQATIKAAKRETEGKLRYLSDNAHKAKHEIENIIKHAKTQVRNLESQAKRAHKLSERTTFPTDAISARDVNKELDNLGKSIEQMSSDGKAFGERMIKKAKLISTKACNMLESLEENNDEIEDRLDSLMESRTTSIDSGISLEDMDPAQRTIDKLVSQAQKYCIDTSEQCSFLTEELDNLAFQITEHSADAENTLKDITDSLEKIVQYCKEVDGRKESRKFDSRDATKAYTPIEEKAKTKRSSTELEAIVKQCREVAESTLKRATEVTEALKQKVGGINDSLINCSEHSRVKREKLEDKAEQLAEEICDTPEYTQLLKDQGLKHPDTLFEEIKFQCLEEKRKMKQLNGKLTDTDSSISKVSTDLKARARTLVKEAKQLMHNARRASVDSTAGKADGCRHKSDEIMEKCQVLMKDLNAQSEDMTKKLEEILTDSNLCSRRFYEEADKVNAELDKMIISFEKHRDVTKGYESTDQPVQKRLFNSQQMLEALKKQTMDVERQSINEDINSKKLAKTLAEESNKILNNLDAKNDKINADLENLNHETKALNEQLQQKAKKLIDDLEKAPQNLLDSRDAERSKRLSCMVDDVIKNGNSNIKKLMEKADGVSCSIVKKSEDIKGRTDKLQTKILNDRISFASLDVSDEDKVSTKTQLQDVIDECKGIMEAFGDEANEVCFNIGKVKMDSAEIDREAECQTDAVQSELQDLTYMYASMVQGCKRDRHRGTLELFDHLKDSERDIDAFLTYFERLAETMEEESQVITNNLSRKLMLATQNIFDMGDQLKRWTNELKSQAAIIRVTMLKTEKPQESKHLSNLEVSADKIETLGCNINKSITKIKDNADCMEDKIHVLSQEYGEHVKNILAEIDHLKSCKVSLAGITSVENHQQIFKDLEERMESTQSHVNILSEKVDSFHVELYEIEMELGVLCQQVDESVTSLKKDLQDVLRNYHSSCIPKTKSRRRICLDKIKQLQCTSKGNRSIIKDSSELLTSLEEEADVAVNDLIDEKNTALERIANLSSQSDDIASHLDKKTKKLESDIEDASSGSVKEQHLKSTHMLSKKAEGIKRDVNLGLEKLNSRKSHMDAIVNNIASGYKKKAKQLMKKAQVAAENIRRASLDPNTTQEEQDQLQKDFDGLVDNSKSLLSEIVEKTDELEYNIFELEVDAGALSKNAQDSSNALEKDLDAIMHDHYSAVMPKPEKRFTKTIDLIQNLKRDSRLENPAAIVRNSALLMESFKGESESMVDELKDKNQDFGNYLGNHSEKSDLLARDINRMAQKIQTTLESSEKEKPNPDSLAKTNTVKQSMMKMENKTKQNLKRLQQDMRNVNANIDQLSDSYPHQAERIIREAIDIANNIQNKSINEKDESYRHFEGKIDEALAIANKACDEANDVHFSIYNLGMEETLLSNSLDEMALKTKNNLGELVRGDGSLGKEDLKSSAADIIESIKALKDKPVYDKEELIDKPRRLVSVLHSGRDMIKELVKRGQSVQKRAHSKGDEMDHLVENLNTRLSACEKILKDAPQVSPIKDKWGRMKDLRAQLENLNKKVSTARNQVELGIKEINQDLLNISQDYDDNIEEIARAVDTVAGVISEASFNQSDDTKTVHAMLDNIVKKSTRLKENFGEKLNVAYFEVFKTETDLENLEGNEPEVGVIGDELNNIMLEYRKFIDGEKLGSRKNTIDELNQLKNIEKDNISLVNDSALLAKSVEMHCANTIDELAGLHENTHARIGAVTQEAKALVKELSLQAKNVGDRLDNRPASRQVERRKTITKKIDELSRLSKVATENLTRDSIIAKNKIEKLSSTEQGPSQKMMVLSSKAKELFAEPIPLYHDLDNLRQNFDEIVNDSIQLVKEFDTTNDDASSQVLKMDIELDVLQTVLGQKSKEIREDLDKIPEEKPTAKTKEIQEDVEEFEKHHLQKMSEREAAAKYVLDAVDLKRKEILKELKETKEKLDNDFTKTMQIAKAIVCNLSENYSTAQERIDKNFVKANHKNFEDVHRKIEDMTSSFENDASALQKSKCLIVEKIEHVNSDFDGRIGRLCCNLTKMNEMHESGKRQQTTGSERKYICGEYDKVINDAKVLLRELSENANAITQNANTFYSDVNNLTHEVSQEAKELTEELEKLTLEQDQLEKDYQLNEKTNESRKIRQRFREAVQRVIRKTADQSRTENVEKEVLLDKCKAAFHEVKQELQFLSDDLDNREKRLKERVDQVNVLWEEQIRALKERMKSIEGPTSEEDHCEPKSEQTTRIEELSVDTTSVLMSLAQRLGDLRMAINNSLSETENMTEKIDGVIKDLSNNFKYEKVDAIQKNVDGLCSSLKQVAKNAMEKHGTFAEDFQTLSTYADSSEKAFAYRRQVISNDLEALLLHKQDVINLKNRQSMLERRRQSSAAATMALIERRSIDEKGEKINADNLLCQFNVFAETFADESKSLSKYLISHENSTTEELEQASTYYSETLEILTNYESELQDLVTKSLFDPELFVSIYQDEWYAVSSRVRDLSSSCPNVQTDLTNRQSNLSKRVHLAVTNFSQRTDDLVQEAKMLFCDLQLIMQTTSAGGLEEIQSRFHNISESSKSLLKDFTDETNLFTQSLDNLVNESKSFSTEFELRSDVIKEDVIRMLCIVRALPVVTAPNPDLNPTLQRQQVTGRVVKHLLETLNSHTSDVPLQTHVSKMVLNILVKEINLIEHDLSAELCCTKSTLEQVATNNMNNKEKLIHKLDLVFDTLHNAPLEHQKLVEERTEVVREISKEVTDLFDGAKTQTGKLCDKAELLEKDSKEIRQHFAKRAESLEKDAKVALTKTEQVSPDSQKVFERTASNCEIGKLSEKIMEELFDKTTKIIEDIERLEDECAVVETDVDRDSQEIDNKIKNFLGNFEKLKSAADKEREQQIAKEEEVQRKMLSVEKLKSKLTSMFTNRDIVPENCIPHNDIVKRLDNIHAKQMSAEAKLEGHKVESKTKLDNILNRLDQLQDKVDKVPQSVKLPVSYIEYDLNSLRESVQNAKNENNTAIARLNGKYHDLKVGVEKLAAEFTSRGEKMVNNIQVLDKDLDNKIALREGIKDGELWATLDSTAAQFRKLMKELIARMPAMNTCCVEVDREIDTAAQSLNKIVDDSHQKLGNLSEELQSCLSRDAKTKTQTDTEGENRLSKINDAINMLNKVNLTSPPYRASAAAHIQKLSETVFAETTLMTNNLSGKKDTVVEKVREYSKTADLLIDDERKKKDLLKDDLDSLPFQLTSDVRSEGQEIRQLENEMVQIFNELKEKKESINRKSMKIEEQLGGVSVETHDNLGTLKDMVDNALGKLQLDSTPNETYPEKLESLQVLIQDVCCSAKGIMTSLVETSNAFEWDMDAIVEDSAQMVESISTKCDNATERIDGIRIRLASKVDELQKSKDADRDAMTSEESKVTRRVTRQSKGPLSELKSAQLKAIDKEQDFVVNVGESVDTDFEKERFLPRSRGTRSGTTSKEDKSETPSVAIDKGQYATRRLMKTPALALGEEWEKIKTAVQTLNTDMNLQRKKATSYVENVSSTTVFDSSRLASSKSAPVKNVDHPSFSDLSRSAGGILSSRPCKMKSMEKMKEKLRQEHKEEVAEDVRKTDGLVADEKKPDIYLQEQQQKKDLKFTLKSVYSMVDGIPPHCIMSSVIHEEGAVQVEETYTQEDSGRRGRLERNLSKHSQKQKPERFNKSKSHQRFRDVPDAQDGRIDKKDNVSKDPKQDWTEEKHKDKEGSLKTFETLTEEHQKSSSNLARIGSTVTETQTPFQKNKYKTSPSRNDIGLIASSISSQVLRKLKEGARGPGKAISTAAVNIDGKIPCGIKKTPEENEQENRIRPNASSSGIPIASQRLSFENVFQHWKENARAVSQMSLQKKEIHDWHKNHDFSSKDILMRIRKIKQQQSHDLLLDNTHPEPPVYQTSSSKSMHASDTNVDSNQRKLHGKKIQSHLLISESQTKDKGSGTSLKESTSAKTWVRRGKSEQSSSVRPVKKGSAKFQAVAKVQHWSHDEIAKRLGPLPVDNTANVHQLQTECISKKLIFSYVKQVGLPEFANAESKIRPRVVIRRHRKQPEDDDLEEEFEGSKNEAQTTTNTPIRRGTKKSLRRSDTAKPTRDSLRDATPRTPRYLQKTTQPMVPMKLFFKVPDRATEYQDIYPDGPPKKKKKQRGYSQKQAQVQLQARKIEKGQPQPVRRFTTIKTRRSRKPGMPRTRKKKINKGKISVDVNRRPESQGVQATRPSTMYSSYLDMFKSEEKKKPSEPKYDPSKKYKSIFEAKVDEASAYIKKYAPSQIPDDAVERPNMSVVTETTKLSALKSAPEHFAAKKQCPYLEIFSPGLQLGGYRGPYMPEIRVSGQPLFHSVSSPYAHQHSEIVMKSDTFLKIPGDTQQKNVTSEINGSRAVKDGIKYLVSYKDHKSNTASKYVVSYERSTRWPTKEPQGERGVMRGDRLRTLPGEQTGENVPVAKERIRFQDVSSPIKTPQKNEARQGNIKSDVTLPREGALEKRVKIVTPGERKALKVGVRVFTGDELPRGEARVSNYKVTVNDISSMSVQQNVLHIDRAPVSMTDAKGKFKATTSGDSASPKIKKRWKYISEVSDEREFEKQTKKPRYIFLDMDAKAFQKERPTTDEMPNLTLINIDFPADHPSNEPKLQRKRYTGSPSQPANKATRPYTRVIGESEQNPRMSGHEFIELPSGAGCVGIKSYVSLTTSGDKYKSLLNRDNYIAVNPSGIDVSSLNAASVLNKLDRKDASVYGTKTSQTPVTQGTANTSVTITETGAIDAKLSCASPSSSTSRHSEQHTRSTSSYETSKGTLTSTCGGTQQPFNRTPLKTHPFVSNEETTSMPSSVQTLTTDNSYEPTPPASCLAGFKRKTIPCFGFVSKKKRQKKYAVKAEKTSNTKNGQNKEDTRNRFSNLKKSFFRKS